MPENSKPEADGSPVTVDFIRHRNVLLVQVDLGPLFTDYYLHLADHHLRHTPEQDAIFKGMLAVFALHCAARPQGEHIAWTVNLQNPLLKGNGDVYTTMILRRLLYPAKDLLSPDAGFVYFLHHSIRRKTLSECFRQF